MPVGKEFNVLTESIIGAAIEVHRILGPGLLESAYQTCMARELALRRIAFEQQKQLPIEYKGDAPGSEKGASDH